MMWGSNVPVTRTPDAHWMAEVRYRGTKVVVGQPGLCGQHQVRRRVDAVRAGTDGAMAMAMGHVILREFLVDQPHPVLRRLRPQYTDLPFLIALEEQGGAYMPGKNLTAADLGEPVRGPRSSRCWWTARTGEVVVPNGSLGFRYTDSGVGKWNLDLGEIVPQLTVLGLPEGLATVKLTRFDTPDGHAEVLTRGVPVRRVGDHLCCTVFDLMLAQYGVSRDGLPGNWPAGYDDAAEPYTPAWQEPITGVSARR